MKALLSWSVAFYRDHGTKILSALTMIVAGLPQIDGLVADGDKPYWAAGNMILGALTFNRGFVNSRNANIPAEPPARDP